MSYLDFLYPRIPLGDWADAFIGWFGVVFQWLINGFTWLMQTSYERLFLVLSFPKVLVDNETIAESSVLRALLVIMMMLIFAGIAWAASNWKVALFTFLGFYAIWAPGPVGELDVHAGARDRGGRRRARTRSAAGCARARNRRSFR